MPQLVMQNLGLPTVVIEDPRGVTEFVVSIRQNEIRAVDVTTDVLERLTPYLNALEAEASPDFHWSVFVPPDTGSTVTQTTGDMSIYVDSVTGDDGNTGQTPATAKKTLAAAFRMIPPDVKHKVVVHMSGVFEDSGNVYVSNYLSPSALIILDGGSDLVAVAGPFTATNSAVTGLEVVGAGWTPDAYTGYWIEILSGPEIGALRFVQLNDSDTLQVSKEFDSDPGLCSFRFVRPATEFKASAVSSGLYVSGCHGSGQVALQRIYVSGTQAYVAAVQNQVAVSIAQCVIDSSWATQGLLAENLEVFELTEGYIDPVSFAVDRSSGIGVAVRQAPTVITACRRVALWGSVLDETTLARSGLGVGSGGIRRGSRIKQLFGADVQGNRDTDVSIPQISSEVGYAPVRFLGATGSGLTFVNSFLIVGDNVEISDNSVHGIVLERSQLTLRGILAGSGNGAFAIYAHSQSTVLIKDGSPPTISGVLGAVTVDGTTVGTAWNSVAIGSPFVDVPELTMVKEVP